MDYVAKESSFLKKRSNGLMLSDDDIELLIENDINYLDCHNIDELIYLISNKIDDSEDSTLLEELNIKLSEMKYYNYTNK